MEMQLIKQDMVWAGAAHNSFTVPSTVASIVLVALVLSWFEKTNQKLL
jgi:hypothetical protein